MMSLSGRVQMYYLFLETYVFSLLKSNPVDFPLAGLQYKM